jgi:GH25 family lysozyme M1 (1,4-beta-N-acetylmuramidase)
MTAKGCDVSNYTGNLTANHAACLRQNGIEHVVVRASLEAPGMISIAKQQLGVLRDGGLSTSLYAWTYGDWDARQTVRDTITAFGTLATTRLLWLDVEPYSLSNPRLPSIAWLHEAVDEAKQQGWTPGIYTGRWVWVDRNYPYRNTAEFAGEPLWTAEYDGAADLGAWSHYGGWTDPLAGKQYAGSGQQSLCGLFVDLNVFDPAVIAPPAPPIPEPVPEPAHCISLDEVRGWLHDDMQNTEDRVALRLERLDTIEAGG